jgi:uncharacterized protein YdgA (DUF945 family)
VKKIVLILVALAVAYAASAYFIGLRAQAVVDARLEQARADAPAVKISLLRKSQGIFTSSATYAVSMDLPAQPGKEVPGKALSLDVTLNLDHGPVVFSGGPSACLALVDTTFASNQETSQAVKDFLSKFPEIAQTRYTTRVAYDGSGVSTVTIPPANRTVALEDGSSLQVEWQPVTAVAGFSADGTETDLTASCPLLRMGDGKAMVSLTGFAVAAKGKRIAGKLWTGSYRMTLDSLDAKPQAPNQPFHLDKAYANLALTPKGDVLDYAIELGGNGKSGSNMAVPASFSLLISNLDMAALGEMQALLQKQAQPGAPAQAVTPAEWLQVGNAFLARAPQIDLSFKALEGDLGPVSLQAWIKTDNMKEVPMNPQVAASQLRAWAKLDGPANGVIELACLLTQDRAKRPASDPAFRQEIAAQIDQLVLQGILSPAGNRLVSEASWDGAGLTVNGKRMQ